MHASDGESANRGTIIAGIYISEAAVRLYFFYAPLYSSKISLEEAQKDYEENEKQERFAKRTNCQHHRKVTKLYSGFVHALQPGICVSSSRCNGTLPTRNGTA